MFKKSPELLGSIFLGILLIFLLTPPLRPYISSVTFGEGLSIFIALVTFYTALVAHKGNRIAERSFKTMITPKLILEPDLSTPSQFFLNIRNSSNITVSGVRIRVEIPHEDNVFVSLETEINSQKPIPVIEPQSSKKYASFPSENCKWDTTKVNVTFTFLNALNERDSIKDTFILNLPYTPE